MSLQCTQMTTSLEESGGPSRHSQTHLRKLNHLQLRKHDLLFQLRPMDLNTE
jgi:hypothetical protein